jgi:hypothetical protein
MGISAWGYSWATLSPAVINTETWSFRLGVGRWTNNVKRLLLRNPKRGGQGPYWAAEPYDDDDDDSIPLILSACKILMTVITNVAAHLCKSNTVSPSSAPYFKTCVRPN